jgi:hypothetical protein
MLPALAQRASEAVILTSNLHLQLLGARPCMPSLRLNRRWLEVRGSNKLTDVTSPPFRWADAQRLHPGSQDQRHRLRRPDAQEEGQVLGLTPAQRAIWHVYGSEEQPTDARVKNDRPSMPCHSTGSRHRTGCQARELTLVRMSCKVAAVDHVAIEL